MASIYDAYLAQPKGYQVLAQHRQQQLQEIQLNDSREFNKQRLEIDRERLKLEQRQQKNLERESLLKSATAKQLAPLQLEKLQTEIEAGRVDIAAKQQELGIKYRNHNQQQAKFISEYYSGVRDDASLKQANDTLVGLGVLDPYRVPKNVGQARLLYEGSKMFQKELEFDRKRSETSDQNAFTVNLEREKATLQSQLEGQRQNLGLSKAVGIELLRQQNRMKELQKKADLGLGGGVNVNFDPGLFGGLPKREYGGPVQAGQPYIVGEAGPEVVVPQESGTVIPNPQTQMNAPLGQFQIPGIAETAAQGDALRGRLLDLPQEPDTQQEGPTSSPQDRALIKGQLAKGRVPVYDESGKITSFKQVPGTKDRTPEDAAKIKSLEVAQKAYKGVEDLVFDKKGNVDYVNLFNSDLPIVGGSVPYSKGRELGIRMEYGIQAITRAETGAAMAPGELANTKKRFMPQLGDSESVIRIKMSMYQEFLNGTLKLIAGEKDDPKFDEVSFKTEYAARAKEEYIKSFLAKNPGATREQAEGFIQYKNKSFIPE